MARKRHYEFYDPKTGETVTVTPKKANSMLDGNFMNQVAHLKMNEHLWLYTGIRVKCVQ